MALKTIDYGHDPKKNSTCTLESFNKCAVGIKHLGQKILEKSINMLDENLYILLKKLIVCLVK